MDITAAKEAEADSAATRNRARAAHRRRCPVHLRPRPGWGASFLREQSVARLPWPGFFRRRLSTRSRTSFGIPVPLSSTDISIHGLGDGAPCWDTRPSSRSMYLSAIMSVPPFGIASRELTAKFNNAASSSDASTSQTSGLSAVRPPVRCSRRLPAGSEAQTDEPACSKVDQNTPLCPGVLPEAGALLRWY